MRHGHHGRPPAEDRSSAGADGLRASPVDLRRRPQQQQPQEPPGSSGPGGRRESRIRSEPGSAQDDSQTPGSGDGTMHIDCASCPVRGEACDDCLVSVLLGPPQIDDAATAAIAVLSERGLVPPLRDPRSGSVRAG